MDTSETVEPKAEPEAGRSLGATPKTGFHGFHNASKKGFATNGCGSKKKSKGKEQNGHSDSDIAMETLNKDLSAALPDPDEEVDPVPEMDCSVPKWLEDALKKDVSS